MVDVTGFAKLIQPQIPDVGRSIQAGAMGQQMRLDRQQAAQTGQLRDIAMQGEQMKLDEMRLNKAKEMGADKLVQQAIEMKRNNDRQGFNSTVSDLYAINPKAAKETYDFFGTLEQQDLVDSAYILKAATSLPLDDVEGRHAALSQARDTLNNSNHLISQGYDEMIGENDPNKLNEGMLNYLGMANKFRLFGDASEGAKMQKTGAYLVRDKDTGQVSIVAGAFDPTSGQMQVTSGQLPTNYEVVSKMGETAGEETTREIEETKKKKQIEQAIGMSTKYAEKADLLNKNIMTLDEGIMLAEKAIAEGKSLGRGWIESKFPKITKTAADFNEISQQLGLGVIQSTTFGALSADEMKLAMEAAMPQYTSDADSLAWMKRRRAAQQKLKDQLDEAAAFLGEGGTVAEWKKMQVAKRKLRERQEAETKSATPAPAAGQPAPTQDYTQMSSTDIMQNLVKSMGQ